MWWNILWAFLIPLGFIGISLAILALAFGKVKIPYWSASGSGATKCWGGLAFLIVLNVVLWILHSYTVQYIKINDPRPAFLMINLTAGIWILGLSLGAKFWGKLLMVALSWLFLGTGFAFYQQSPAEFKAQAAANEARLENQLPRSGEKVIMAPVREWETISFPAGSKSWYYDQGPHHIKLQNLAGWKAEDYGAGESVETPKGDTLPKRTFQFMSLEETPVQITLRWE